VNEALFKSGKMDWGTPQGFFDRLDEEFGFTLEACAKRDNAKAYNYLGPDQEYEGWRNGLAAQWPGVVWMNPPYGREVGIWCAYASGQALHNHLCHKVVALLPARTDTTWWHDWVMLAAEVRLVRGRLRFEGAENSAPFPSVVVIWAPGHYPHGPVFTTMKANP
jgi:phage N-6-adenine-methyltransferase